ncbi:hypothetical protein NDU88_007691 [Pleurodeles waltl]|uniref:Uncharacterized protein n=1 Tax=Pleurodeles waltl TaxID=8319 RepID=A0AAV7NUB8_PLEWA|nr:hypothetical protein NDU88_007691 [Pleurodeles waltl]
MCALSNQALLSVQSLKLPVRLGADDMCLHEGQLLQGCIRSASPSPPAAVASLHTCTQGSVATTAGPLGLALGPCPRLRPGPERAAASVGISPGAPGKDIRCLCIKIGLLCRTDRCRKEKTP